MGRINVLDKHMAELIAAGEVVERPASVIKEMVENSIDAGATAVTVEIKNGGVSFMRIADNGCGIMRDDVKKAFLRHATSKIKDKNDLDKIGTLGFRGEALASISAVSDMTLITRCPEDFMGTSYKIRGGEELQLEDVGCPAGTTFIVRELFYNVPARMKFLKKDVSEGNAVSAVMDRLALTHPEIAFTYIKDGKTSLKTTGDGKLRSAIYSVFGRDFVNTLIPVDYTLEGVHVYGYISKPVYARPNRNMQNFFINGRYVKTKTGIVALEEACKGSVMVGKFPSCVLNIELDFSMVDVNVHPSKIEVRFVNERPVFDAVYHGVKSCLLKEDTNKKAVINQRKTPFSENSGKSVNPFEMAQMIFRKRDESALHNAQRNSSGAYSDNQAIEKKTAENNPAEAVSPLSSLSKPDKRLDSVTDNVTDKGTDKTGEYKTDKGKSGIGNTDAGKDSEYKEYNPMDELDIGEPGENSSAQKKNSPVEENISFAKHGEGTGDISDSSVNGINNIKSSGEKGAYRTAEKNQNIDIEAADEKDLYKADFSPNKGGETEGKIKKVTPSDEYLKVLKERLISNMKTQGSFSSPEEDHDFNDVEKPADIKADLQINDDREAEKNIEIEAEAAKPLTRFVGELFNTYIVLEAGSDELLLVDKHAAHERILYEKLKKEKGHGFSQLLLEPIRVVLDKNDYDSCVENLEVLRDAGFEVEDFGYGTVIVRSAPQYLDEEDIYDSVVEMADYISKNKKDISTDRMDWIYHNMACRAAVKGGNINSEEELMEIVRILEENPQLKYCPHGRPIVVSISKREIEKQFGRV